MLRSNISLSKRIKITKLCKQHFAIIELTLMNDFSLIKRFLLILNVWINKINQFFFKINAYYIDNYWRFKKILLNFKSLITNHFEFEMINIVFLLIPKYFIKSGLLIITIDNALFNETLRRHLNTLLLNNINIRWNHQKKLYSMYNTCNLINNERDIQNVKNQTQQNNERKKNV